MKVDEHGDRRLPGDVVGDQIGKLTTFCVRHAKLVVLVTLVLTGTLAVGLRNIELDQELSDGLPDSNPNKRALDRVMDKLPGVSTLEAVLFELDPEKAGPQGITDIRQQDAIRAEEYVYQYVAKRAPQLSAGVGLNHVIKQVRVVINNNDPAFYEMPPDTPTGRVEFDMLWGIANNTIRPNIELTIRNDDYQSTTLALQYDAPLNTDASKEAGHAIAAAFGEYRAAVAAGEVPDQYDLFHEEYLYNLGVQSGLAKFEGHLRDELPIFVPAAFLLIFMCLWIGLRNPGTAVIGIFSLFVAATCTIGLMGWLRIPFTSNNIAMIPLIVGSGIDYAIHVLNEYTEERSKGHSLEGTFRIVGGRAGVAMVLATSTSVAGLLSLLFASSVAFQNIAISASFALLTVTILALTFLPAATTLVGDRLHAQFKPSGFMPKVYRVVNRRKAIALVIFIGISGVLWYNTTNLEYFTDLTGSNFPEDDQFVQSYQHLGDRQQGSADELVIIEGDLTDPATLAYIRAIEEDLMTKTEYVASRAHVNSLTVLLGAYEVLANTGNAAGPLVQSGLTAFLADPDNPAGPTGNDDHIRNSAPTDRATIEADIEAMQNNIAWAPLLNFLYAEDGSLTIIDVLVANPGERSLESLRSIQEALEDSVNSQEHLRPDGVEVHVNGLNTGLYQFLDFSFKWLQILFLVSAVTGTILMFLFTHSVRATFAFLVPMLVTTTWFLGILPFFGILVGAGMILPIIFITSIGSDYSAHLSWNILKTGHPEETYRTTGKAIFFSALTDFLAFFVFSFSYLKGGVSHVALATALAILAVFVVTMLVLPLFFNKELRDENPPPSELSHLMEGSGAMQGHRVKATLREA